MLKNAIVAQLKKISNRDFSQHDRFPRLLHREVADLQNEFEKEDLLNIVHVAAASSDCQFVVSATIPKPLPKFSDVKEVTEIEWHEDEQPFLKDALSEQSDRDNFSPTFARTAAEITSAVSEINIISYETKLLALNAAVEAAKSSRQQVREFAIVAEEAAAVAKRSANMANDIFVLVNGSFVKINSLAKLQNDANANISRIVTAMEQINEIMNDINSARDWQSSAIDRVLSAHEFVDDFFHQKTINMELAILTTDKFLNEIRQFWQAAKHGLLGDTFLSRSARLRRMHRRQATKQKHNRIKARA